MSAFVVAFIAALGIATWSFRKLQNRTGYGNERNAYIGAVVIFVVTFLVIFTIGHAVLSTDS